MGVCVFACFWQYFLLLLIWIVAAATWMRFAISSNRDTNNNNNTSSQHQQFAKWGHSAVYRHNSAWQQRNVVSAAAARMLFPIVAQIKF